MSLRPGREPNFKLTSPDGVTTIEVWDNDILATDTTTTDDSQDVIVVTDDQGERRVTFNEFLAILPTGGAAR